MSETHDVRRRWFGRVSAAALLLAAVSLALYYVELTTVQRDYFRQRQGTLVDVRQEPPERTDDAHILQNVSLTSSSGLIVHVRLLRPLDDTRQRLPTLLLVGGHRTGKRAVDLLERPGNVAFAAIDYPYDGPRRTRGWWQKLRALDDVQQTTIDTPPAMLLAVEWLLDQPWVDPRRLELVGISFGVPFAAAAGALDPRISRVWLVQGGGDNTAWAEFNLRKQIGNDLIRRLATKLVLLFIYAESFDTLQWMREIAPRPIIVVSAREDERVPPGSALAELTPIDSAEIIWTEGRHVRRTRREELQILFDIFRARITPDQPTR